MTELLRGTVTFLFTDIEGSTRLVRTLRDRYGDVLAEHERILREAFAGHGGQLIDTQGDAFFVAFPRATDAVEAAIAAQLALAANDWPENGEVRVRMGLHTGEPVVGQDRYTGLGVHRAARICAAGHGGQILLSSVTRELVEDELPDTVELRDLGEQRLKDMPRAERVFQLEAPGLLQDFPPLRTADLEPFAGRESELAEEAHSALAPRWYRRRGLLAGALAGVLAAAVAIPIFALASGSGGGGGSSSVSGESVSLLDPETGKVIKEVDVPGNPGAIAVGEGAVWVTDSGANTVSRIDLDSDEVNDTIPVGSGPTAITVGGGAVWVANALDGTVSRIDPTTGDQTPIFVGNGPAGITYGNGAVWVVNAADRTVSRIDPNTVKVVGKPLRAGAAGPGIAVGAGAVWVTDQASGTVTRVDIATGTPRPVPVGGGPTGIAYADDALWVTNNLDGTVSKIDPATNSVRGTTPVGAAPADVAVSTDSVWVTNEFGGEVARLDPVSGGLVGTVQTGSRPTGLASSADGFWLSAAPAAEAHRGGRLRVQVQGLDVIDPALAYSPPSWLIASMTNDGLVAFQRSGGTDGTQLVPDLAVSLPAPTNGGRTYTFQVRPDVHYSDGTRVRASDFRRAIERAFALESDGRAFFGGIVGADVCGRGRCDLSRGIAADDAVGTVTFRLAAPDPDFFYKLALPFAYAVPKSVGMRQAKTGVPATGPYMVESYRAQRSLRLVRNPRFRAWSHAAKPGGYADEIDWTFVREGESEAEAVLNGSADISMDNPSPEELRQLQLQRPAQVHVNPQRSTTAFVLNMRAPPFDRVGVRRAVNFAVDRPVATRLGGAGVARPTCQINPANFPGYGRYCPYHFDLDRARKLTSGSGARGTAVTVWTTSVPGWPELGRYGVSVLNKIGLRASLRRVPPERYFERIFRPDVQMSVFGWVADFAAPSQFLQPNFTCGSHSNWAHFCDRSVDAGIRRGLRTQVSNPLAANEVWAGVDREVVDAAPWAPLFNPAEVHVVSERVGNYQYNPQWGVLLDQLWVK